MLKGVETQLMATPGAGAGAGGVGGTGDRTVSRRFGGNGLFWPLRVLQQVLAADV